MAAQALLESYHELVHSSNVNYRDYLLDLHNAMNVLSLQEKRMIHLAYIDPVVSNNKSSNGGNPGTARGGRLRTWSEISRDYDLPRRRGRAMAPMYMNTIINNAISKLDEALHYED